MRKLALLCLLAPGISCSSSLSNSSEGSTNQDGPLIVHEWGTFTSMLGSSGAVLEGLHHEEERLPQFVHARLFGDPLHTKGLETTPTGVTQKLETPVLYFYAQKAQKVTVHVDFPEGVVSQWYPEAAGYQPAIGRLGKVAGGSMDWQAELAPGISDFPAVAPDDIWAPSRKVASVPLKVGAEHEQFIFYRGLGTFTVPFRATADADGTLSIKNDSSDAIPSIFLLRLSNAGGAITELGGLAAGQSLTKVVPPSGSRPVDDYVADAANRVAAALQKSGLNADEARAMVDTWSKSYFRSQGLRILYVVPRAWTDRLLPITISPQPSSLVRTLVGRVEVLTPLDESQLADQVRAAAASEMPSTDLIAKLDRFAEPKLRRVQQLVTEPAVQTYLSNAISAAQFQP